jgi:hypothetical protein
VLKSGHNGIRAVCKGNPQSVDFEGLTNLSGYARVEFGPWWRTALVCLESPMLRDLIAHSSITSRETVEKLIRNLAVILDGVDFGGVFYFLKLTALS